MKLREEFEAWFKTVYKRDVGKRNGPLYIDYVASTSWTAWHRSRQSAAMGGRVVDIFKIIVAVILFSMPFIALVGLCDSMHHFEPLDDDDYDLGPDWKDPL